MVTDITTIKPECMTISAVEQCLHLRNLINRDSIDWAGNCKFDINGKVVGFVRESQNNSYGLRPIPRDGDTLSKARIDKATLESALKPATREEILVAIKRLSMHCGMQGRSQEDFKYLLIDYCEDLAKYPNHLINKACKQWRMMPEGNNYLPKTGQLIEMMYGDYRTLERKLAQVNKILGN